LWDRALTYIGVCGIIYILEVSMLIVKCDGAGPQKNKRGCSVAVLWNTDVIHPEEPPLKYKRKILVNYTTVMLEYMAVLLGLRLISEFVEDEGIPNTEAIVFSDSNCVVFQLMGIWQVTHLSHIRLKERILEKTRELIDRGVAISFMWCPRSMNREADDYAGTSLRRK
jgi:ribonuclease HI